MTRKERRLWATAIHEAGHAVASVVYRKPFKYVTIIPKDEAFGHVRLKPPRPDCSMETSFAFLVISLSGYSADRAFGLRGPSYWYETDRAGALEHAMDISGSAKEAGLWIRIAEMRSASLVEIWKPSIEAVADALLISPTMQWQEVRAIALRARGVAGV